MDSDKMPDKISGFKIGDHVKILYATYGDTEHDVGLIGQITSFTQYGAMVKVPHNSECFSSNTHRLEALSCVDKNTNYNNKKDNVPTYDDIPKSVLAEVYNKYCDIYREKSIKIPWSRLDCPMCFYIDSEYDTINMYDNFKDACEEHCPLYHLRWCRLSPDISKLHPSYYPSYHHANKEKWLESVRSFLWEIGPDFEIGCHVIVNKVSTTDEGLISGTNNSLNRIYKIEDINGRDVRLSSGEWHGMSNLSLVDVPIPIGTTIKYDDSSSTIKNIKLFKIEYYVIDRVDNNIHYVAYGHDILPEGYSYHLDLYGVNDINDMIASQEEISDYLAHKRIQKLSVGDIVRITDKASSSYNYIFTVTQVYPPTETYNEYRYSDVGFALYEYNQLTYIGQSTSFDVHTTRYGFVLERSKRAPSDDEPKISYILKIAHDWMSDQLTHDKNEETK